jgi:hypothetical protein
MVRRRASLAVAATMRICRKTKSSNLLKSCQLPGEAERDTRKSIDNGMLIRLSSLALRIINGEDAFASIG